MGVAGGSGQYLLYCAGGEFAGSLVAFEDYLYSGAYGDVFSLAAVYAHDVSETGSRVIYDWSCFCPILGCSNLWFNTRER